MGITARDLDSLCSPAYLEGADHAPVTELRERRDVCQRAELLLSYLRRVVQAETDLVAAEIVLRKDTGESDVERLVAELPRILVSGPSRPEPSSQHVPAPATEVLAPITDLEGAETAEELLSSVLGIDGAGAPNPAGLLPGANLCTFDDGELLVVLERLREQETVLSRRRRALHERIDELQAMIVDRYKTGAADPDTLLA